MKNPRAHRIIYYKITSSQIHIEMAKIGTQEKGNTLVKGQVFLWEGAKDWHDLWDEEGFIIQ